MQISTTRFGDVVVADEKVITFPNGIPGLDDLRRYALLSNAEIDPFHWLQSLDDPDVALAVVNPFALFDYTPEIPEDVFKELALEHDSDALLLTVAVIPEDFKDMTTNLCSPILINVAKNIGTQIILTLGDYELRQPIYEAVRAYVAAREGEADAGSGTQD